MSNTELQSGECVEGDANSLFPEKSVVGSFLSHAFLHGGIWHLISNMWLFWIVGNNVDDVYGSLRFILFYLAAAVVAAAAFVVLNSGATVPAIGASGAVSAVLGAYAVHFPRHRILTLIVVFPVTVPAWVFALVFFVTQFLGDQTGIAWEAHVGGLLFGIFVGFLVKDSVEALVEEREGTEPFLREVASRGATAAG